jgi:hypothetical protein
MSIDAAPLTICPARVTLDAAQLSFFDGLPADAPSVQSELGCELEQGHDGSHAALGQEVDTTMWWVQWTLSASEVNRYTWCRPPQEPTAESRDKDDAEKDCTLFDGHPGRHTNRWAWRESQAA